MSKLEECARAISGQDEAGWLALPENDRERLYGGGKWHDAGRTREDYRDDARRVLLALREPDAGMVAAADAVDDASDPYGETRATGEWHFTAMIDAALGEGK